MKRIVIVSRQQAPDVDLFLWVKSLFPECEIEIVVGGDAAEQIRGQGPSIGCYEAGASIL